MPKTILSTLFLIGNEGFPDTPESKNWDIKALGKRADEVGLVGSRRKNYLRLVGSSPCTRVGADDGNQAVSNSTNSREKMFRVQTARRNGKSRNSTRQLAQSALGYIPKSKASTKRRSQLSPNIPCRVVDLTDKPEAVCSITMDGFYVPRVRFPALVLRRKGLKVGAYCHWRMRDALRIRASDIVADVPQPVERETVDMETLESLYAEMEQRVTETGGQWPVFTGDGA